MTADEPHRPRILLVTHGNVDVRAGGCTLTVRRGSAAWLPAADADPVLSTASPTAQVFIATVGRSGVA